MENNQMNQFFNEQPAQPEQPAQSPFAQPAAQPEQPAQSPFAQPAAQPAQPAQTPFAQPAAQPAQPAQSPFAQPAAQPAQPAQSPFAQQTAQPAQPAQSPFAQPTAGVNQSFNMNNLNVEAEITPEMKKKFTMASNIAVASGGVLIIATLIRIIINFLALGEITKVINAYTNMARRSGVSTSAISGTQSTLQLEVVVGFVILAIAIGFTVLAFFLRTAKRKTIAINIIVFSSIFIALLVFGLITSGSNIPQLNSQIVALEKLNTFSGRDAADTQTIIQGLKAISGLGTGLIVVGFISLIGWAGMLTGGILRANVKDNKPVVKW